MLPVQAFNDAKDRQKFQGKQIEKNQHVAVWEHICSYSSLLFYIQGRLGSIPLSQASQVIHKLEERRLLAGQLGVPKLHT